MKSKITPIATWSALDTLASEGKITPKALYAIAENDQMAKGETFSTYSRLYRQLETGNLRIKTDGLTDPFNLLVEVSYEVTGGIATETKTISVNPTVDTVEISLPIGTTKIDLSGTGNAGVGAIEVDCSEMVNLSDIVLTGNEATLTTLDLSNTKITTIVLETFTALTTLIITNNTTLTELYANLTLITSLDVSTNTALSYLNVSSAPLDATALNDIMTDLQDRTSTTAGTFEMIGCTGTATATTSIATAKNWTVITE